MIIIFIHEVRCGGHKENLPNIPDTWKKLLRPSQKVHFVIFIAFFSPPKRVEVAENQNSFQGWGNDDLQQSKDLKQPLFSVLLI